MLFFLKNDMKSVLTRYKINRGLLFHLSIFISLFIIQIVAFKPFYLTDNLFFWDENDVLRNIKAFGNDGAIWTPTFYEQYLRVFIFNIFQYSKSYYFYLFIFLRTIFGLISNEFIYKISKSNLLSLGVTFSFLLAPQFPYHQFPLLFAVFAVSSILYILSLLFYELCLNNKNSLTAFLYFLFSNFTGFIALLISYPIYIPCEIFKIGLIFKSSKGKNTLEKLKSFKYFIFLPNILIIYFVYKLIYNVSLKSGFVDYNTAGIFDFLDVLNSEFNLKLSRYFLSLISDSFDLIFTSWFTPFFVLSSFNLGTFIHSINGFFLAITLSFLTYFIFFSLYKLIVFLRIKDLDNVYKLNFNPKSNFTRKIFYILMIIFYPIVYLILNLSTVLKIVFSHSKNSQKLIYKNVKKIENKEIIVLFSIISLACYVTFLSIAKRTFIFFPDSGYSRYSYMACFFGIIIFFIIAFQLLDNNRKLIFTSLFVSFLVSSSVLMNNYLMPHVKDLKTLKIETQARFFSQPSNLIKYLLPKDLNAFNVFSYPSLIRSKFYYLNSLDGVDVHREFKFFDDIMSWKSFNYNNQSPKYNNLNAAYHENKRTCVQFNGEVMLDEQEISNSEKLFEKDDLIKRKLKKISLKKIPTKLVGILESDNSSIEKFCILYQIMHNAIENKDEEMMRNVLNYRVRLGGLGAIKNEQIYPFLLGSLILDGEEEGYKGFLNQIYPEFRDKADRLAKEYVSNIYKAI